MPDDRTTRATDQKLTDVKPSWPGVAKRLKRPAKQHQGELDDRDKTYVARADRVRAPKRFWPHAAASGAFRHFAAQR